LLDAAGDYFYVLSEGFSQLRRVRVDGPADPETLDLSFKPFKTRFFPDQTRVAIVGGVDGKLAIVEVAKKTDSGVEPCPMRIVAEYSVGRSPADVDVKTTPGGEELLYVADRFNGKLVEMGVENGAILRTWDVGREPFCLDVTPDGHKVVVADRLTEMSANKAFSCAKVFVVDLESGESQTVELCNADNLLQDMTLTPDGRYALVSCVRGNTLHTASGVSGGWLNANGVLCVDVDKATLVEFFVLDNARLAAGNPWGLACSDDGERLAVAIAGTDEIIFLPLKRLIQTAEERPNWARPGYSAVAYSDLPVEDAQLPFRMRASFGFKGMRQIVARGNDVYALSYFDDVVCKATLKLNPPFKRFVEGAYEGIPEDPPRALDEEDAKSNDGLTFRFTKLESKFPTDGVEIERSFARLASKPRLTTRRRGEIVFHDATACLEQWMSCVTCHPDGRSDGLNWDLLNDGSGNAKSSKSMLLTHETPPSMVSGVRATGEIAVRAGFPHILETNYEEENALAVDEYLSTMRPVPSPRLVDGRLSESARRGKGVFDRIGCSNCHNGELYTDMRLHRTGSQDVNDQVEKFDTPTLIEVWRTAPYMNNGEYPTIRDVLEKARHGVKDGRYDALTAREQDDLIEFVLSL
ncbi:MAG: hypothetical protein IKX88_16765, partial [Thermoguttaceae bacterium]|nr:hypothetical protein [Thermoguttaceae bacterium]